MVVPKGRKTNRPVKKALRNRLDKLLVGAVTVKTDINQPDFGRAENQAKAKAF